MAKLRQLFLLIVKNFKLQFRHPFVTVFELGIPLLFSILLICIRINVSSEYISYPTIYKPFNVSHIPVPQSEFSSAEWTFLYAPNTTLIGGVIERVVKKLGNNIKDRGFSHERALVDYYLNNSATGEAYAGIIFDGNSSSFDSDIKYKIRLKSFRESTSSVFKLGSGTWRTEYVFPFLQDLGPREKESIDGGAPGYMDRGFLPIQHAVAMSIIEDLVPIKNINVLNMQRYPYPPYDDDGFIKYSQFYLPIAFMLSFIYPCLNIVKNIVAEKEKELKQLMKMMGLSNWMHATAWFIKYFVFLGISVGLITLLLTVKFKEERAVINYSDPSLLFLFLLIYITSTISFCFLLSVFFSKANSAAAGAGIIFFLTFLPYLFIYPHYNELTLSAKLASCVLTNNALAMASIVLLKWEATGIGLHLETLSATPTPDDGISMNYIFMMMIIDCIMYAVLAWYIEAVFPGEYGIPEPWHFPFTKAYWCGHQQTSPDLAQFYDSSMKSWEYFEVEPIGLMPGIQMQGLTKVYDNKKVPAVNNLYMNIYRGQITVLLGHNGAGKTTTVSMLTGLFPPTSGTAIVNGSDICDDIEGVHSSLGICPQHNVLFDDLTVEEHLRFFCKLKGYLPELVPEEVNHTITALSLEEKRHALAKTLSGGMKRKLSVGIALVGGSQVVILDEPTSGMDPSARRLTWDLLESEKEHRTILLTTHFMEEADILGDRIAIMAAGEIKCCGSPLFLKKRYGAGYHLVIVKAPGCDVSIISRLVMSHVPTAEISKDIGAELSYLLPMESSKLFKDLFAEIEKKHDDLNISSFGASITTMEEVFIKVGERTSPHDIPNHNLTYEVFQDDVTRASLTDSGAHDLESMPSSATQSIASAEIHMVEEKNTGIVLFFQQMGALLMRRILYSLRNWKLTFSQLILPAFLLILVLLILRTITLEKDSPALLLNLTPFHWTNVPYSLGKNSTKEKALATAFLSQLSDKDKPLLTGNVTQYLIDEGEKHIAEYNLHEIIGVSIDYDKAEKLLQVISLFNNQAFHSPAISLAYTDNMLLKYFTNFTYSLSVVNHPMPRTVREKGDQLLLQPAESYEISQNIVFGMSFLVSSFVVFLVKEYSIRSKHLQRVSGVNFFSYWLATFFWDFICYTLSCLLMLIVFRAFGTAGMSSGNEQGRLFLLYALHGLSALPFVYFLSFWFHVPSTAYVVICLFNVITGIGTMFTVMILEIPQIGVTNVANSLDWTFSALLPSYCLGRSVTNLYQNHQFNDMCNKPLVQYLCSLNVSSPAKPCCRGKCDELCIPWESNYFSWNEPGIGRQLMFLSIQAVVFLILLTALELKVFRALKYRMTKSRTTPPAPVGGDADEAIEDDDVAAERQMILNTPFTDLCGSNRLVVRDLRKYYGPLLAVDNLSFCIKNGECFSLLGLNGAGKTTTFKVITGECSITSGDVYLDNLSIRTSMRKVQQRLGYCPQFDALVEEFTGRETLTMYAHLRGLKKHVIPQEVSKLSCLLSFNEHIDKLVKEYSGGNRRKLSVAIALIGDPPMVFLDEPTSGMDPVSRHKTWDVLLHVLKSGRSIVLTSHRMEECEALSNKLAIMVNGRLRCLGSPQQLKSKFGNGFTLLLKVKRSPVRATTELKCSNTTAAVNFTDEVLLVHPELHPICSHVCHKDEAAFKEEIRRVKSFIEEQFPGSILKDVHEGYLHYHIPKSGLRWSEVFGIIEMAIEEKIVNIEDYSVGETTLEQVFLNFARSQRESEIFD